MSHRHSSDPSTLLRSALGVIAEFSPEVLDLGRKFTDAGYELALVGGPVRDAFLGRLSSDLDFATNATPEETEKILATWTTTHWDIGRDFGTIGAKKGETVVEVTTYRTESYDPATRKPEVVYGDTLDGDLSRRDFTVNAMAIRVPDLVFVDPFNGLEALASKTLDTPVTAVQSFDDDPLRIMRAARFAAQLDFAVSEGVLEAMSDMADRLSIVSAERIRDEFVKLMLSKNPRTGLELMVHTGVADVVLPELPGMQLTIDEHHRHKDVYEHTLTVLDQAIALETGSDGPVPSPDLILRLSALLHDIGKPATRRHEPGGGVSFHHHEVVGAKMTTKRMRLMRFDKATIKAVSKLVALHLRFHGYGEAKWTDAAVRRYVTDAGDQLERLHRLTRADCTTRNKRKAARLAHAYDDLEQRINELAKEEELKAIRPDLDGNEIMEILGLKPGKDVGAAYKHMLAVRMEHGPMSREEAIAELQRWWQSRT